jgi:hypothetical protein
VRPGARQLKKALGETDRNFGLAHSVWIVHCGIRYLAGLRQADRGLYHGIGRRNGLDYFAGGLSVQ